MPNKATGNLSTSILNDLSKMNIGGDLSFTPRDANDLWFYSEQIFDATSEPLIKADMQYHMRAHRADGSEKVTHANDQLRWLAVKNTGTTDGSTSTTEGIVISLNGDTAAYNEVKGVYIGAGELWVCKFPSVTTLATPHVATVAVTNDVPSGTGSDVMCIVAAIIDDVA